MAEKGWTARVAAAAGVAAGTGAAQLGLGYGLGVVVWPAVPADDSIWLGSLGWATWIAASSTVFGAVIAGRLGRPAVGPWRLALAASAAVGALLTVALIALPARAAVRTDTFSPQTIAGGYAVLGVLLGLVIAYWAVVSRPVAANLIATAAWLWSLAVAAVVATIFWHRPSATYLSSWQFISPDPDGRYGIISWPSALLTLLAALVVGVIGALPAVRRSDLGVGAAASGAVGPLLVAAAFFVLAPQLTGTPGPLQSAYLIAPYAVLAGLAGSALTVGLGQRRAGRRLAGSSGIAPGTPADDEAAGAVSATAVATGAQPTTTRSTGARPTGARSTAAQPATTRSTAAQPAEAQPAGTQPAGDRPTRARPAEAQPAGAQPAGSGTAVVPSPRPAPKARPNPRDQAGPDSPAASAPAAATWAPRTDGEPAPRRSFMDRFRRDKAGNRDAESPVDPSAIATGRAKAPASATSPAPQTPTPSRPDPASQVATPPRPDPASQALTPPHPDPASRTPTPPQSDPAPRAAAPPRPDAAPSGLAAPTARGAVSARAKPSAGSPKAAVPSADGTPRPAASTTPGRSDSRTTVAPPPASPPIATINDSPSGERRPAHPTPSRAANSESGPANTASSDKSPPARKTAAKSTKATPPRASAPAPKQARATGGRAAKAARPKDTSPWADDADTAELPVQEPRSSGEGGSR